MWARHGFAPPNLRVLLKVHTPIEFNTSFHVGMHTIDNYASPIPQKAHLSFINLQETFPPSFLFHLFGFILSLKA